MIAATPNIFKVSFFEGESDEPVFIKHCSAKDETSACKAAMEDFKKTSDFKRGGDYEYHCETMDPSSSTAH